MSLLTLNFTLDAAWRATLNKVFQQLRRVKFVVENSFSFGDFDPEINWNGMAATAVDVRRARYLKIFKMFWFSVDIRATLAAPFAAGVFITLPSVIISNANEKSGVQGGGAYMFNAGTAEVGTWSGNAGTNILNAYRPGTAVHTAGAFIFIANGFLEIE